MKSERPTITLLGNNSGRNLGDAAILASLLHNLSELLPDARFLVPSTIPAFIDDNYSKLYNACGIDVRPRTLSLRLLGLPTIRALAKSDIALICDGIIFGYRLFSPHNFLITLIFLVPFAKLFRCKLVCHCCGIGPFPSRLSRAFARYLLNNCDLVIMRDEDSKALARKVGVGVPIEVSGDAAFANSISSRERAKSIAKEEGIDLEFQLLGLNITSYLDSWLEKSERVSSRKEFLDAYAEGVNLALARLAKDGQRLQPVIFSCSPMDEDFSEEFAKRVSGKVLNNTKYLSHDLQAVMRECRLLLGMRFHSLVLSSAAGTPIVGLVYAPKVRSYMNLLGCRDFALALAELTPELLASKLVEAWSISGALREKQQEVVEELRRRTLLSVSRLCKRYFPERMTARHSP